MTRVLWLNVGTAFTANGFVSQALPPGQYRIAVTTATAVYAALTSVPSYQSRSNKQRGAGERIRAFGRPEPNEKGDPKAARVISTR